MSTFTTAEFASLVDRELCGRTTKRALQLLVAACLILSQPLRAQIARGYGGVEISMLPGGRANYPTAINASGQIVGASGTTFGKDHAFLYAPVRGTTDLGAFGSAAEVPFLESVAWGINASGVIVGTSNATNAIVIRNGVVSALPKFHPEASPRSEAFGINTAGHIVGRATSATVRQFVGGVTNGALHAFLYRDGVTIDLGTIGGVPGASAAYAINDRGQVVGQSDTFGGNGFDHAFGWVNGQMYDLGTLPGYEESIAYAINSSGVVVGGATSRRISPVRRAWVYSNDTMRELGALSATRSSTALGINDAGVIVGTADNSAGLSVAFAYTPESGMVDLNTLLTLGIVIDTGATGNFQRLTSAVAINNSGEIVCRAQYSNGIRAVLLKPGQSVVSIAAHPASQTVSPGQPATLSVSATGDGLSYQWFKDGGAIAGATSASLVLPSASAADAGSYTVTVENLVSSVTSRAAILSVGHAPAPSRLVNLSIRSTAAAGDDMLIVGIVIGGAGTNGSKPILARAIGPALEGFGVAGFLADPILSLYSGSARMAENDNWSGAAQVSSASAQVGAFALTSAASRDAAIYNATLAPGNYSLQISGAGNSSGVVLAEVYDATSGASFSSTTPRLVNASARTQVGTEANILIAGFAIAGSVPKAVLVRAIGPTLSQFGVGGTLTDPQLKLFDSAGHEIASNGDWGGSAALSNAFGSVGAFTLPAASKDAALTATLSPGSYTAQVSGAANGTGVALVEIYELP